MLRLSKVIHAVMLLASTLFTHLLDVSRFLCLCLRPSPALAAENLFLRKQLALYQEHHVTSRRASHAARITLLWLSQWFDWQPALAVVQPETFKRWRRQGYHLFWHWTPCPGRPPIPMELQRLIRQMARENLTWGQRRIANELQLKLGLRVSPRTVRKYLPRHLNRAPGQRLPSQRWRTFVHNHAWDLVTRGMAVDFTRSVQAVAAWMRGLLQRCRRQPVARGVRGTRRRDTTCRSRLSTPASELAASSPLIVGAIHVDQRSPPDHEPSCTHDPSLATRATSVDRFDVCPADVALHWWNRANLHTQGARPLSKGGSRAVPWRRVA
jgi:hypothetical protein